MKQQRLVIRKFVFCNSLGRKSSRQMNLVEVIVRSDFTPMDVENICALPVGEGLMWPSEPWGIRRVK